MTDAAQARGDKPASGTNAALGWVVAIAVNIVLPIITFTVLSRAGVGPVAALLLSGVWPVLETAKTRALSPLSLWVHSVVRS